MITGSFDVVGAHAPLAFFETMDTSRLSHGYLFTGAAGVGKKTFARRLAQSLLCETPKDALLGYCSHCVACTLFAAGTHPDFVEAAGEIKIGGADERSDALTARELVRLLSLHGYRSAFRVVLLADVTFATHAAANALLKFFEEPPAGVVVILTTDAPGRLIDTIRSRMVDVPFGLLSKAEIETILAKRGIPAERAALAAEVAMGSAARALEVLEDDDGGLRQAAVGWFGAALSGSAYDLRLDERGAGAAERRDVLASMLEHVRVVARDWAVLNAGAAEAPMLAADLRSEIERMPRRPAAEAVSVLTAVAGVMRMAKTNVSPALVADYLRMELAPAGASATSAER
jgi:DNA polymerase-3 subunit delta'